MTAFRNLQALQLLDCVKLKPKLNSGCGSLNVAAPGKLTGAP